MMIGPFRTALQALRTKHAKEIMLLSADFLDKEVLKQNESASMMKSATIKEVYERNHKEKAERIMKEASASYDITIANMGYNEFKELKRRRQTLRRPCIQYRST